MNQINFNVRLACLILSAGLMSCAKDETTKVRDTYKAPPPVINNKGAQDLKTWDRRSDKSLDLQDSFDVSAGNPAKLEVTSRCRINQKSFVQDFLLNPRMPIKIFQVLPIELLTRDIAAEKINCDFVLVLSNDVGSKHIYQISPTPVTDETDPGVSLEKTGSAEKVTKFHSAKMEGLRARYRNAGPAAAQVFCQDMSLSDLPFEQVLDLLNFDFTKPELKAGRHVDILMENPLQPCRLLVHQAGVIQQISARFLVQLPKPPVLAALAQVLVPGSAEKLNFYNGAGITIGVVAVTNPDRSGTRFLKIRKSGHQSSVEIFGPVVDRIARMNGENEKIALNSVRLPWLNTSPVPFPGVSIKDGGDHWRISIPAGLTVKIMLIVVPPGPRFCAQQSFRIQTEDLAVSGAVSLTEISENGEPLSEIAVAFPRVSYPSRWAYEKQIQPVAGIPCGW